MDRIKIFLIFFTIAIMGFEIGWAEDLSRVNKANNGVEFDLHLIGTDLRYERLITNGLSAFIGIGADLVGFFTFIPVGDYHVHAGLTSYPLARFDRLFIQLGGGYAFEAAANDVNPAMFLGNVGWKFSAVGPFYLRLCGGYIYLDEASNPTLGIAVGCQF